VSQFAFFLDWFLRPPAFLVACLVTLLTIGCPLLAAIATWWYAILSWDYKNQGQPTSALAFVVAGVASLSVLAITGTAVVWLIKILFQAE
jgi:hypothetical protein